MFVCCNCCVLSGKEFCDELITCPEESYRLWCVVVRDLETSRMRRPWPALGRSATKKKIMIWGEVAMIFVVGLRDMTSCSLYTLRQPFIACRQSVIYTTYILQNTAICFGHLNATIFMLYTEL
jgi:hypothetical protein